MVSWLLRDRPPDELHRLAFPVVSGCGKRLLAEPGGKMSLKLAAAAAFETGVLNLIYAGHDHRQFRFRPVMGRWRTGTCPASSGIRPAGSGSGWSPSTAPRWPR